MFHTVNVFRQLVLAASTLVLVACGGGGGGDSGGGTGNSTYDVTVTVTGLTGTLNLSNGADALKLVAQDNGTTKTITSGLADGTAFNVVLTSQPLKQICKIESGAINNIASANAKVAIACGPTFDVNVTVNGLNPDSFLTILNGNDSVTFSSDTKNLPIISTLTLTTGLIDADAYAVTIGSNPVKQVCTVDPIAGSVIAGEGNIAATDANLTITCVSSYDVNIKVTGLEAGKFVTVINGTDSVTFSADAIETLTTGLLDTDSYTVVVDSQPVGQLCRVLPAGSGNSNIAAADVEIAINCGTAYGLGVTVTGLNSAALNLKDALIVSNGSNSVTFENDGSLLLSTLLTGDTFAVTIDPTSQPIGQFCEILPAASANSSIGIADVNINITCKNLAYKVSVNVTGLVAGAAGVLKLDNLINGDTINNITTDGTYDFGVSVFKGDQFIVGIGQTQGNQFCSVTNGFGRVIGNSVTASVICSDVTYPVAVNVTGLVGAGPLKLINFNQPIDVIANGITQFAVQVAGSGYDIRVAQNGQPAGQICKITAGTGTVTSAVAGVTVNISCGTAYTVGVDVSNFSGTLSLLNNLGNPLTISANGPATFTQGLTDLQGFSVTVDKQSGQVCTIGDALVPKAGNIAAASVVIPVVCVTERNISVNVTNAGGSVQLQNNGADTSPTINTSSVYQFPIPVLDGATYAITVLNDSGQVCNVDEALVPATGIVSADVTVNVACIAERIINVNVSNLNITNITGALTVTIQNNLKNDLLISGTISKRFSLPVLEGNLYAVTILSQQGQVCNFVNPALAVATAGATDVTLEVICKTERKISVDVTGFANTVLPLILENNTDHLEIIVDGRFAFTNPVLDGNGYAVTIIQSIGLKCVLPNNISGTANGADILVTLLCAADADNDGFLDINDFFPNDANRYAKEQFDLSTLSGINGFTIKGIDSADSSGISVSSIADITGDGINEIMIAASGAMGTGKITNVPNQVDNVGETYIIYGSDVPNYWETAIDLSNLNGKGFVIRGLDELDESGFAVSGLGDINGDTIPDFVITAAKADLDSGILVDGVPAENDIINVGETYVLFGSATWPNIFELKNLTAANGFTISGISELDLSGSSVSDAGDINGDGISDIIIGAFGANVEVEIAPGQIEVKISAGQTYVLFGKATNTWGASFDLTTLATGGGIAGFVINGAFDDDLSGTSVSGAGDINGDSIDDILIGAQNASLNGLSFSGATYVVYGRNATATWPAIFDLATMTVDDGFIIAGAAAGDHSGISVSNAGDINKDGIADIFIGASQADNTTDPAVVLTNSGESYIVFGKAAVVPAPAPNAGPAAVLSLSTLNGTNGFSLKGININDQSGIAVSDVGDVNGDGIDDLIIGATLADPNGIGLAGESYVVFGHANPWLTQFDLTTMTGLEGFTLNGIAEGDNTGVAVSGAGDINGDGIMDMIVGANLADTSATILDSGKTYIIFGCHYGVNVLNTDPSLFCRK